MPADSNCYGQFTTSLIEPDAETRFRISYQEDSASAVVLNSDGYEPEGGFPWKLLNNAVENWETYQESDLIEEMVSEDHRGDDQTIVLFLNENAFTEKYKKEVREQAAEEAEKVHKFHKQEKLLEEKREFEAFLTAGL